MSDAVWVLSANLSITTLRGNELQTINIGNHYFVRLQVFPPPYAAPSVQHPELRQLASLGAQWSEVHLAWLSPFGLLAHRALH